MRSQESLICQRKEIEAMKAVLQAESTSCVNRCLHVQLEANKKKARREIREEGQRSLHHAEGLEKTKQQHIDMYQEITKRLQQSSGEAYAM